jgi:magnesium-transporting ATPase (P-type)
MDAIPPAFAALVAIPVSLPQPAGHHPARGERAVLATGDVASFVVVVTIVTASISRDFVQEVRAQNAVEALRRSLVVQAIVLPACL